MIIGMSAVSIPVMKPLIPDFLKVQEYLRQMDSSGIYSNWGPKIKELERRIAEHVNIDPEKVVACSSATIGIQGAIAQLPVLTVIAPVFTFPASNLAVINSAKKLQLHDVDRDTWALNLNNFQNKNETGYLKVVPFGGEIDLTDGAHLDHLVIDAAASLGSFPIDLENLPRTWAVVFSLHATKVLGIGEGGAVVFGDIEKARKFRAWINFGFYGSRDSNQTGTNGKLSEIAACYGLAAFDHWQTERSEWKSVQDVSKNIDVKFGISSILRTNQGVSPYWIASFKNQAVTNRIIELFAKNGIETRKWWSSGCHKMSIFQANCVGSFENTDWISSTTLGLPLWRHMPESNFKRISELLEEALGDS
jgi:dTDP-4-amino-4,6-dideoxygalactose transaminase